jgi:hypothetical protein
MVGLKGERQVDGDGCFTRSSLPAGYRDNQRGTPLAPFISHLADTAPDLPFLPWPSTFRLRGVNPAGRFRPKSKEAHHSARLSRSRFSPSGRMDP